MSTKYFCAHCDEEFTPERAESKPRCPRCMRKGGVQAVDETPVASGSRDRTVVIVVVAMVLAGIGYGAYRAQRVSLEPTPPLRPLEASELAAYLERDQIRAGTR